MRRSFAISVFVHGVVLLVLLNFDNAGVVARAPSEYQQKIAGRETKIIWYKLRKELPEVSPPRRPAEERALRAEVKAQQSVVSSPRDAPKRIQMVWTPAPQLTPTPLIESPNLLAITLPEIPRPPAKRFTQPPAPTPMIAAKPQVAAAVPLLETQATLPAPLPSFRLPPKPYTAPPPAPRESLTRLNQLSDAPVLATSTALTSNSLPSPKLPPRPFNAPLSGTGSAPSKSVAVDAPPPLNMRADAQNLNVAIVGLNPLDTHAPPPTVSSPATFSSGPQVRASGATSEGAGKGLSVPDLFVRGPRDAKSDLIAQAYAAPTSPENLRAAMLRGEPTMTVHVNPAAPPASGVAKVTSAPDPRFNGRDVYMLAIQMPNLTSYSGSWLMWYSGRTLHETGLPPIAAPVPHRKVDPKYIATAAEERIEGRIQLACVIDRHGNVSAVELVRGLDDRLNQSAREALAKWQFYPALRNGEPIDVDVLVEIPFRLAPRTSGAR